MMRLFPTNDLWYQLPRLHRVCLRIVIACLLALLGMLALTVANAHAQQPAPECVPPAQLKAVSDQRNQAQDQVAAIVANASAQIEKLTKERDEARAKMDVKPK